MSDERTPDDIRIAKLITKYNETLKAIDAEFAKETKYLLRLALVVTLVFVIVVALVPHGT